MPPPCNSRRVADDCNVFARCGRVVYGVRETDRPVTFTQNEKEVKSDGEPSRMVLTILMAAIRGGRRRGNRRGMII